VGVGVGGVGGWPPPPHPPIPNPQSPIPNPQGIFIIFIFQKVFEYYEFIINIINKNVNNA